MIVIALDGPAGAGKGEIGGRLCAHYKLAFLDTGALYRAVGRDALAGGVSLDDEAALEAVAQALDVATLDDPALRTVAVGEAASKVAALPRVRDALLKLQRDFAARPPGEVAGALLDGRDIGTVICPDADVKVFLTASPEERARRRAAQLRAAGEEVDEAELARSIAERDKRDAERTVAPMRPADDAVLLDTTDMSIDAAFEAARRLVDDALARKRRDAARP
ncbi:MAG: (d)CMP kinase [Maricaulaceae bacterium]|jgi:cytidylate kinase